MQIIQKKYVRKRGVILSPQGLRKLNKAKSEREIEHNFKRYTLEVLSEETGLTPTTLSKVFTSSSGVDKRTLECCFDTFNLILLDEDYLYLKLEQTDSMEISSLLSAENDPQLEALSNQSDIPQRQKMTQLKPSLQASSPNIPGGPIPLNSVFYIDCPALDSLCYDGIQQSGMPLNIRASMQMGKTSLMTRILSRAKSLDYHTVYVNLQLADTEILQNLERFLQWFCARVSKQLKLPSQVIEFWGNSLGSKSKATDYLNDILLAKLTRPVVVAIDELNQLFAYPEIAREFLLLLRTWSELAKSRITVGNPWQKLRLVTIHSTQILVPTSIEPFLLNSGLVIKLPEFTVTQVQELAERYQQEITEKQIKQLITLLGGNPYRLQLAFYFLQHHSITLKKLLENTKMTFSIYAEHLEQQWWNLQRYPRLWDIFTQIVMQTNPADCTPEQGLQLKQMGLVNLHGLQISLACELFRPFFCDRLSQLHR